MFRNITLFFALCFVALSAFAQPESPPAKYAVGFNVDLLPTVLSATQSEFGYSVQGWIGRNHLRLRLVGAHLIMPNSMIGNDQFLNLRNDVGAVICDYTFGDNFDKWWIGSGFEIWQQRIEHKFIAINSNKHTDEVLDYVPVTDGWEEWPSVVFTVGGGYIWKFYRNFYIDPWAAGHYVLNPKDITISGDRYKPPRFQAEASLKLGWNFNL